MQKTSGSYKSYIKNASELKRRGKLTYGEWVKRFGKDSIREYGDDVESAKLGRMLGLADYGTDGESLCALGLNGSGYRDYVALKNEKNYADAVSEAEQKRDKSEKENSIEYGRYSDSYDKTESKLFENVVKNITDGYVTDYGKIFEYANSTGLTRERAELAAKSGYEAIIQRLREKVLVGITKYHYGEYGTYKYALALGLPEQMARELAEHALRVNEKDILESEHLGKLQ